MKKSSGDWVRRVLDALERQADNLSRLERVAIKVVVALAGVVSVFGEIFRIIFERLPWR